ncbi:MAG: hypothetical protein QF719_05845 [Chloroflexota bacterium]|jgi:hypothetical protein|nr:hypothetical protein [Chloroflexota bacterium]MDP6757721.1 hypothetical protein [Chloroflexota bacterium]
MKQEATNNAEISEESIRLSPTAQVAGWSAAHRWWVVLAAVMTLVLAGFVSSTFEMKQLGNDGGGVGESQIAAQLLEERSDKRDESAGVEEQTELLVISHARLTADDPRFQSRVEELTGELNRLTKVQSVFSFYNTGNTISGTGAGVYLSSGSTNGTVTGNTFDNSVVNSGSRIGVGVYFISGAEPTFGGAGGLANTIQNNTTGIWVSCSSSSLDLSANTFTNSGAGRTDDACV